MYTDPIADFLTRIRNSLMAGRNIVQIPSSKLKVQITKTLYDQGYILSYKIEKVNHYKSIIKIALKYDMNNQPAIKCIKRISRPGLRAYSSSKNLPRVLNGLGIAIISTSKGLMTDKQARRENLGGEILCFVY